MNFECRVTRRKVGWAQMCTSGLATWKAQLSLTYMILNSQDWQIRTRMLFLCVQWPHLEFPG